MGLGVLAMACAIVKVTQLPRQTLPDFTWEFFGLLIWTFIESTVVIVCACVPTLPKLIQRIVGKHEKSTYRLYDYPSKSTRQRNVGASGESYDTIIDNKRPNLPESNEAATAQHFDNSRNITRTFEVCQEWDAV
ncbi:MAG: hypothetical protein M1820_003840 [Bogoriella megaspora]|nr:MAG: hypothetical protein M1820_003840 [Bogoriella megaspora]